MDPAPSLFTRPSGLRLHAFLLASQPMFNEGCIRTQAYELCDRPDLPTIRLGYPMIGSDLWRFLQGLGQLGAMKALKGSAAIVRLELPCVPRVWRTTIDPDA